MSEENDSDANGDALFRAAGRVHAYVVGLRGRLGDLVVHPLDEAAAMRIRRELAGELAAGDERKAALRSLNELREVEGQQDPGEGTTT